MDTFKKLSVAIIGALAGLLALAGCSGGTGPQINTWLDFAQAVKDRSAMNCTITMPDGQPIIVQTTQGWTSIHEYSQQEFCSPGDLRGPRGCVQSGSHAWALPDHNIYLLDIYSDSYPLDEDSDCHLCGQWSGESPEIRAGDQGSVREGRFYDLEDLYGYNDFYITWYSSEEIEDWLRDPAWVDSTSFDFYGATLSCGPVTDSLFDLPTGVDFY
jgi:hypothetical protein